MKVAFPDYGGLTFKGAATSGNNRRGRSVHASYRSWARTMVKVGWKLSRRFMSAE